MNIPVEILSHLTETKCYDLSDNLYEVLDREFQHHFENVGDQCVAIENLKSIADNVRKHGIRVDVLDTVNSHDQLSELLGIPREKLLQITDGEILINSIETMLDQLDLHCDASIEVFEKWWIGWATGLSPLLLPTSGKFGAFMGGAKGRAAALLVMLIIYGTLVFIEKRLGKMKFTDSEIADIATLNGGMLNRRVGVIDITPKLVFSVLTEFPKIMKILTEGLKDPAVINRDQIGDLFRNAELYIDVDGTANKVKTLPEWDDASKRNSATSKGWTGRLLNKALKDSMTYRSELKYFMETTRDQIKRIQTEVKKAKKVARNELTDVDDEEIRNFEQNVRVLAASIKGVAQYSRRVLVEVFYAAKKCVS